MRSKILIIVFLFSCSLFASAQKFKEWTDDLLHGKEIDSSNFQRFRSHKVFYSDVNMISAPFSVRFKDSLGQTRHLFYKSNTKPSLGFGFSYKWFTVRLAFSLPAYLRNLETYGESKFLDIGVEFETKRHFYDLDARSYRGYAIKNAYLWDDTLSSAKPHLRKDQLMAQSLSVNTWRFLNKNVKIPILRGKTGLYLKDQQSLYVKTTFNLHGVSSSDTIVPKGFQFPGNSKLSSRVFSAFDFGFIPGYVKVKKIKNWQLSAMFGLGPVLQLKAYEVNEENRYILGFAPRYDIRFIAGYNVPKFFVNLIAEFDNKSIRINDLAYRQSFYTVKLIGGFRIGKKKK